MWKSIEVGTEICVYDFSMADGPIRKKTMRSVAEQHKTVDMSVTNKARRRGIISSSMAGVWIVYANRHQHQLRKQARFGFGADRWENWKSRSTDANRRFHSLTQRKTFFLKVRKCNHDVSPTIVSALYQIDT